MKTVVTGANSSVGKNLLTLLADQTDHQIVAGCRSESAFSSLPSATNISPATIDYSNHESLSEVIAGADCVIHLAGILIESKHSNYASANIAATESVLAAAKACDVKHFIFISVVGATPDSSNAYFRSKGVAEKFVRESGIPSSIIRTPILLGVESAGAQTLKYATSKGKTKVLGGGHYTMRPLDVDDLCQALIKLIEKAATDTNTFELVGPEPVLYRDLIIQAGKIKGVDIEVGSAPILIAKIGSAITSIIKGGGISPTVIDVITMNEVVSENADDALGIKLTPLNDTLTKILAEK